MSTKRDLVEAYSFNRRRLVTAFVSGAPGGREVEPVRYGRTLVGGLVVALLIVAGAAVSGFLKPTLPKDWKDDGLVIGKSSGARFVAYKGRLYPVINTTSARLLLATDGKLKITTVPDDKIRAQQQGPTIGITGAPDILPASSRLVSSGWSACTNSAGGVKVSIDSRPAATRATDAAFLATAGGTEYVVSGSHRYPLPGGASRTATLRALRLDGEEPHQVSGRWIDLVTPGSSLAPFKVPGAGRTVDTGVSGLTRIGTAVTVAGQHYVLGPDKKLQKLSSFAYAVYRSSGPGLDLGERRLSRSDVVSLQTVDDPAQQLAPADWPSHLVSRYTTPTTPCLLLHAQQGAVPQAQLATARSTSAIPTTTTVAAAVEAGRGALVRSSNGGVLGFGTAFLVDSTGTRYAVGSKGDERAALVALGYGRIKQLVSVPAPWLQLFADGPQLSARAITAASGSR